MGFLVHMENLHRMASIAIVVFLQGAHFLGNCVQKLLLL